MRLRRRQGERGDGLGSRERAGGAGAGSRAVRSREGLARAAGGRGGGARRPSPPAPGAHRGTPCPARSRSSRSGSRPGAPCTPPPRPWRPQDVRAGHASRRRGPGQRGGRGAGSRAGRGRVSSGRSRGAATLWAWAGREPARGPARVAARPGPRVPGAAGAGWRPPAGLPRVPLQRPRRGRPAGLGREPARASRGSEPRARLLGPQRKAGR